MVFLHAIEGLISIIIMVSLGYILTGKGWFNPENSKLLPKLVTYVSLPTYMVWNLLNTFNKEHFITLFSGIIVPVLSMIISFMISFLISNLLHLPPNRKGIFRSAFFCSSSLFIGVPVNLALMGENSIPYVLVYFLANAFLFWTIGNYSISLSGKAVPSKIISIDTVKRVFSPPFIGFMLAVALILLELPLPNFIMSTCKYLGNMTTPLSMLFIGIAIFGVKLSTIQLSKDVIAVLIGRFVISPIAVLLVASVIPIPDLMKKVFVIQAALPSMTQTTILAKVYEADAEYAAVLVTITTLFAILAIPVYMAFI
ncbi:AEC family transporter [Pelosinus sp. IPA-1]|uniref:AEC family transporter n=1 Tax=Pelosinus sp. IPA-1 TaxID=3029569 RepID=UPI0024361D11|nr:AEC family transporter [Pelosinus sp. IPA-1]GMA97333.1 malate transporter [Pelosinus sp. IPA-1]